MAKKFFVAGTDTGVGKTFASCALLSAVKEQGLSTLGLKPIAAGSELIDGVPKNEDAVQLQQHSSIELAYEQVNPVLLDAPTSPHIAAALQAKQVSVSRLVGFCRGALMARPDFALIEGAGGWRVPVNPRETMADLAKQLELPVIMVVSVKLGCLNHAALTAEAILRDGLKVAAWIANQAEPIEMDYQKEYLDSLRSMIPAPMIASLPFHTEKRPETLTKHFDLKCLDL